MPSSERGGLVRWRIEEGGLAFVSLERPEARNALNKEMDAALGRVMADLEDQQVRVSVLSALGPVFCSGADLREVGSTGPRGESASSGFVERIATSRFPWVAAVQGPAVGAGVALVANCLGSVCTSDAWFRLPEIGIGVVPKAVAVQLGRVTGSAACMKLLATGRKVGAREAESLGIVGEAVPAGDLHVRARAIAEELAAGGEAGAWLQARWRAFLAGEEAGNW